MSPGDGPPREDSLVGLLVVPGIGRQRSTVTAQRVARELGGTAFEPISLAGGGRGFRMRIGGVSVLVREASWGERSDLANPPSVLDATDLLRRILEAVRQAGRELTKGVPERPRRLLALLAAVGLVLHFLLTLFALAHVFRGAAAGDPFADVAGLAFGLASACLLLASGYLVLRRIWSASSGRRRLAIVLLCLLSFPLWLFTGMIGAILVYLAVSTPLFYLVVFAGVATTLNLAARWLVRPLGWLSGRWLGQGRPGLQRLLGRGFNSVVNVSIVLPVQALLQVTKAYVNLYSVVVAGGGPGGPADSPARDRLTLTRLKAVLWAVAVTVGALLLLVVCELVLFPIWAPLLDPVFAFLTLPWWFALAISGMILGTLDVPLDWLLDLSNYQVGSRQDRERLFYGVLQEAAEELRREGCTELHVLAHSLGSAIAYDWLAARGPTPEKGLSVATLHTIGSPLNKFWFLDHSIAERARDRTQVPALAQGLWRNYWSPADPISGCLSRYRGVEDRRLGTLGLYLVSHVRYWSRKEVLESIREILSARAPTPGPVDAESGAA